MPKLTEIEKTLILSKLEEGWSIRATANHYHLDKKTILRVKRRWEENGSIQRQVGSGRRRISTVEQDEALINHLRINPHDSARDAAIVSNFPGSSSTVCRRIKYSELKNSPVVRKPLITEEQKQSRIIFCLNYVYRPLQFWHNIVFSDEKVFQSSYNGNIRVYRPPLSRFEERYVAPRNRSGRFSVNLWVWICVHGPGVLWRIDGRFNAQTYRELLDNIMLPSVNQMYPGNNFIFQQDNCPVHTAAVIRQWFAENNVELLPFPAHSADLNPVENVWGLIVKKVYKRNFRPQNENELWQVIENVWDELSVQENLWQNLISSMPNRLNSVLNVNGAITKY